MELGRKLYEIALKIKRRNEIMKKLKLWLQIEERNNSWLARQIGVSPTAVKYWVDGTAMPRRKHIEKINQITGLNL